MQNKMKNKHWSQIQERKGLLGIKFLLLIYKIFGRKCLKIVMTPVVFYFWITGTSQRECSKKYLDKIKRIYEFKGISAHSKLTTYKHFSHFANTLLDKLASWSGDIGIDDLYYPKRNECEQLIQSKKGVILIASHLGNIEMCRAIAHLSHEVTINVLVFTENAVRFNKILNEVNSDSSINLICVSEIGIETTILLKQKLDQGEWVAIVGDRTPITAKHRGKTPIVWVDFLDQKAPFPQGPFILASVLAAPVYLVWGLKPNDHYHFYFEYFMDSISLPRNNRETELQKVVQRYAARLEHYCLISPLDWFNFYDFWALSVPNKIN